MGGTGAIWLSHPECQGFSQQLCPLPGSWAHPGVTPPSVEDVAVKGRVSLLAEWAVERSAGVAHAKACLGGLRLLSAAPGWRQRPARIMGRWTARVPETAGPCWPGAACPVVERTLLPGGCDLGVLRDARSFVTEDQEIEERGEPRWPELVLSAAG